MGDKTRAQNLRYAKRLSYSIDQLASSADKAWLEDKGLCEFLKASGERARRLDRRDLGYFFFDLARRLSPEDTWAEINACIELRDTGKVRVAARRLDRILAAQPQNQFALHEKGVCFLISGEPWKAMEIFRTVVELDPKHIFAWQNLLSTTIATGRFDEAAGFIERLRQVEQIDRGTLLRFEQLISFLENHGPEITEISNRNDLQVTKNDNFPELSTDIATRIGAAIDARRPFSLIRLGDGEGALLAHSTYPDAGGLEALLSANRDDFFARWFGVDAGQATQSIEALVRVLRETIADADLMGVPDGTWWRRELGLASPRGLPSLGTIFVHTRDFGPERLCHHQINHALNEFGGLDKLLTGAKNPIVVIGPHPELDTYVMKRFQATDVRSIRVPARQADVQSLPYRRDNRRHYPEVFEEVCATIASLPAGSICLVGAGPLGKIYCGKAKAHGHVAIDLGSVLDGWIGVTTRFYA
jgi:tetratricopeptide (TPR) repeat protein